MLVIGLDPGYKESTIVDWDGQAIGTFKASLPNYEMITYLDDLKKRVPAETILVSEQMAMYAGHMVGVEVFDSAFWAGILTRSWMPRRWDRILRAKVRGHLGAMKGGDKAVRGALIQRFGPYEEQAIGKKASPGPLYGLTKHEWSAFAVALVWHDLNGAKGPEVRPGVTPQWEEPARPAKSSTDLF